MGRVDFVNVRGGNTNCALRKRIATGPLSTYFCEEIKKTLTALGLNSCNELLLVQIQRESIIKCMSIKILLRKRIRRAP